MRIERLSKKEFKEKFPEREFEGARAVTVMDGDIAGPIIYTPSGMSTRRKLHELYHAEYSQEPKYETPNEVAREEVAAEVFAYRNMSKENLPLGSIRGTVNNLVWNGWKPTVVMGALMRALEGEGIELDTSEKSHIWAYILGRHKIYKEGRY